MNCDGAWEPTIGKAGTGVVARDWRERVVAGRNTTGRDRIAKITKARAIMQAVELALHHKWDDVVIESDAHAIIQSLQKPEVERDWETQYILTDIMEMARGIPRVK